MNRHKVLRAAFHYLYRLYQGIALVPMWVGTVPVWVNVADEIMGSPGMRELAPTAARQPEATSARRLPSVAEAGVAHGEWFALALKAGGDNLAHDEGGVTGDEVAIDTAFHPAQRLSQQG